MYTMICIGIANIPHILTVLSLTVRLHDRERWVDVRKEGQTEKVSESTGKRSNEEWVETIMDSQWFFFRSGSVMFALF